MKTIYIYVHNKEKLKIIFEFDDEETNEELRDSYAEDKLREIINPLCSIRPEEDFYLDDVLEIEEEETLMFKCPKCAEEMKENKELDEVYCDCGYSEHIKK